MGFFSKIFKGIKKVVKGIGKVVKKVVKSKAFKVIAAVALAVVAPQMIPTIMKGITSAGAFVANTIATGASAVWSGVQAAGSALMSGARAVGTGIRKFGSNVFQSVTETISNGVDFMQGQFGLKPTTVAQGNKAVGSNFIKATQGKSFAPVAKKTLGEKIVGGARELGTKALDSITRTAEGEVKNTLADQILGKREDERRASLLTPASKISSIGSYDSSQGYAPLINLATNTQSPYLSYSQGQQLFGGLTPATGTA